MSATSDEISQKWTRFPARPFFSRAYSPKTCDHSIIGGHFRDRWGSVLKTSFIVTAKIFIVMISIMDQKTVFTTFVIKRGNLNETPFLTKEEKAF